MKLTNTTETLISCKSCFKPIRFSSSRNLIEKKPLLCDDCISELKSKLVFKKVFGINIFFLSEYDGLMKSWLMNYKEYGDIELAPCFLSIYKPFLSLFFRDCIYVPLPSKKERIEKRGFDHLEEILKSSSLTYVKALRQEGNVEQKTLAGTRRFGSKGIALEPAAKTLHNKRVVLFDDVMTSGATLEQSLAQLRKVSPSKIMGLILMDNFRVEELKIR